MTARYLAVKALCHQEQNGFANLVLDGELRRAGLESREAAFCTGIFYTVLERRRLLDAVLAQFSKKAIEKLDAPVRNILRSGLAQAWYLDVPVSACVNEAVKLTRAFGKSSAAGMVNAVLRKAVAYDVKQLHFTDKKQQLATLQSLSDEVAALLLEQYGEEAFAIAEATYARHDTAIRVNTLRVTAQELQAELEAEGTLVQDGPWADCLLVRFRGSPAASEAFRAGKFHVQGLASQAAALNLQAEPGMRVLDLCAAPGGKSTTLAETMQNKGELLSCDVTEKRTALIGQNFRRCGIACGKTMVNDAAVYRAEFGGFDRVLCDVPCSGLGILGKKPDIRYKTLETLPELCALQQRILEVGAAYVVPGGRLVYSTCTINKDENERRVEAFLKAHSEFRMGVAKVVPQGALDTGNGMVLLPNRTQTDGFFVAVLERL